MKKLAFFLLSLAFGATLFIWVIRSVGFAEIKKSLLLFAGWEGFVVFCLTLGAIFIGNWKWLVILQSQKAKVKFWKIFWPYLAGFSIMLIIPMLLWLGEFFRGYALKEKEGVDIIKGISSVIIDRILEWTANLIIIAFGIIFFLYKIGLPSKKMGIIFGGTFLVFALLTFFFYFKAFKKESLVKFFLNIFGLKNLNHSVSLLEIEKEIFSFFKINKKAVWIALAMSFLKNYTLYLRAAVLLLYLGKSAGFLSVLSILGFNLLAVMLPIPAALGSHEAVQTVAFGSLGLGLSGATAFTLTIRTAELLIALMGAAAFFKIGTGLLKNSILKK